MKTENIIAALYHLAEGQEDYNSEWFNTITHDPGTKYTPYTIPLMQIAGLIRELEEDLRKQNARASGKSQKLAAAKRLLEVNRAENRKNIFAYPWNEGNVQFLVNGYQLLKLVDDAILPLEPVPENLMPPLNERPMNYDSLLKGMNKENPIELPDLASLKAYIKKEKAKYTGKHKKDCRVVYSFGEDIGMVNAEYLAYMMEILPNATCYRSAKCTYSFYDGENRGLLLGLNIAATEKTQL